MSDSAKNFYEREYAGEKYAPAQVAEEHEAYPKLKALIQQYDLKDRKCLEVGCGRGQFQNMVEDYVGMDLSEEAGRHLQKPFHAASATDMPFEDNEFSAAWSIWVLEHIPDPEKALSEIRRVLSDGGLLILWPAWQCTPWAAEGYPVRPYSDFGLKGKLIKMSIIIRKHILFRLLHILPKRICREITLLLKRKPMRFGYRKLKPNYEHFWMSDSDAVNSMDPHMAIIWFLSRGDTCLNYNGRIKRMTTRTGPIVIQVNKK